MSNPLARIPGIANPAQFPNLHALRDDLLTTRRGSESVDARATTNVYPVTLFRRATPTDAYFALALTAAEPRLVLAGHRLGEALNALLR